MILGVALLLLGLGLFLSAFFSGCETGFYRVNRMRLVLEGLDGNRVARALARLTNHPTLFVATILVGNNLANYLTTLSIVLVTQQITLDFYQLDVLAAVVLSPVVFVYGELLPKSLFFQAPNRLLLRCGPLLFVFVALFLPLLPVLWGLGRLLQLLVGETPLRIQLALARKELDRVFQEGEQAGILRPSQRQLVQRLFAKASQSVQKFSVPAARVTSVQLGSKKTELLRIARRHVTPVVPVREEGGRDLIGYVRVIDLHLQEEEHVREVRPFVKLPHTTHHVVALRTLQNQQEDVACLTDASGNFVGLVYTTDLIEPLLHD